MEHTKQTKVMQEMGEYSLAFFHVNAMRTHYKFLRDSGPKALQKMRQQTWHAAKKQMPNNVPYFCVAIQSIPATSKSGTSFRIIGVLSCYDTYEQCLGVSKAWYVKHKYLENEADKLAWTRKFITGLKEWHDDAGCSDFSHETYNKFMEVTQ